MFDRDMTRRDALGIMGAGALAFVATACKGRGSATAASTDNGAGSTGSAAAASDTSSAGSTASGNAKILVAYYSAQGHTRRVAQAAAGALGADVFEIVPQEPYTDDDLNFNKKRQPRESGARRRVQTRRAPYPNHARRLG